MNRYIIAKIHNGNSLAEVYLQGKSEVSFPSVPIFFNCDYDNEEEFLREGNAKGQGELFFECGKSCEGKIILVIHEGKVHVLRPTGEVLFKKASVRKDIDGYVKILPVEILRVAAISDVPAILASMGANRYYSSGSFREITDAGNIRAIKSVLGQDIEIPNKPGIANAIECLNSVQFETLIAKILEEANLFVPAYRGGTMAGADLFAYNKTKADISIGELLIPAGERKSIQVKLKAHTNRPPGGVDFIVACDAKESSNSFGNEWLKSALQVSQSTGLWLKTSLEWLPAGFLEATIDRL